MVDLVDAEQESIGESQLQPLPLRDILLDVLTSAPMKEQHGLLVKGADRRSVSFWFDKTFHREPSKEELSVLMKVVDISGYDALFGCLAYSQEYADRYGPGGPGGVLTADEIPALWEARNGSPSYEEWAVPATAHSSQAAFTPGPPCALPSPILRRLSSPSQRHAAPCSAWLRGALARQPRRSGQPVRAVRTVGRPVGRRQKTV